MQSSQPSPKSNSHGKKQQSISSFFSSSGTTPKQLSARPGHLSHASSLTSNPSKSDKSVIPKRSNEQSATVPQPASVGPSKRGGPALEDNELPHRKRSRQYGASAGSESKDDSGREAASTLHAIDPNITKPARVTDRTAKFLFSASHTESSPEEPAQVNDEEEKKRKTRLHERFVKRLGKPDSMASFRGRNRLTTEHTEEGEEGSNESSEEASTSARGSKNGVKARKSAPKQTPMEKQVVEIKLQHSDTLLVVEVGYKFRFFGEDARVAARELGIVCIPGKFRFDNHPSEAHLERFASASIPVHRLHVHVKRLVAAGHKVGVVRQLETAALKAAGDNRNAPFVRKLTNLYTKGTYIDDVESFEGSAEGSFPSNSATSYLLCITETNAKGWGADEKVHVGIVAVQPATGDVIYDDFEDGFMRSEIETRLLHIAPCEFLIVGQLSKSTEKLVQHLSGSKINVFGDKIRVERVSRPKTMAAEAYSHVSNFYAGKMGNSTSATDNQASALLGKVLRLPEHVTICLSAMISHMSEYGLEHVFDLTKYFQSFSARSHMLLNGTTLTSLEIYRNQTDHSHKGSLFWTLDRTRTRFGQRLLRKWVGRPLLDKLKLQERISAVEELKEGPQSSVVDKLRELLTKVKIDLEKSLIRIYYGKCVRSELVGVLQALQHVATCFATVHSPRDAGFQSLMLNEAVAVLPTILDDVVRYLNKINIQAAKHDDKYAFFHEDEETEAMLEHKLGIASVEHELSDHRMAVAEKLKKRKVDYVTVAGIEYLVEVENSQLKHVPASWAKISGTKKVSRFHTPEVVRLIQERDQHKESLAAACDAAFEDLLKDISSKYSSLRDCVQSLATLDCLLSLAEVAAQPGYVRPEYTEDICISVEKGRHPMVEQLLLDAYVANDILLRGDGTRAFLVTGPNMGGKSSYVRQVALIAIMGQIGSYVPAQSAKLGMLDAVFTRMGASDNMMAGESTFMVELSETSDILKQASPRSLIILDELGRGTSTHDGVAIAQAVLEYVVRHTRSLTLFITHYQNLSRMANAFYGGDLRNVHMKFTEDRSGGQDITFLYEVGEGVAHRSYGFVL